MSQCEVITFNKHLFTALFITSAHVFADTLAVHTVYFDSAQTLQEVVRLSAQADNDGIALIAKFVRRVKRMVIALHKSRYLNIFRSAAGPPDS